MIGPEESSRVSAVQGRYQMWVGEEHGLERAAATANGGESTPIPVEASLTAALQLGWRMAELYAHVNDTGDPCNDTLLPATGSLEPEDQLELQLRAAAGDARRAGVAEEAESLEELIDSARKAPGSDHAAERFRGKVRCCHVELSKALWARDESAGRAYELGTGLSDTYSRVRRSYAGELDEEERAAWRNVFESGRIERLKRLLDDLQSRLNQRGALVVRHHLDVWREEVPKRIEASGTPSQADVRKGLRRQTIIWRQLIAGDKDPEAYLDSAARAELRGDLRRLVWSRCRRWVAPAFIALFLLVFFLPQALDWYEESVVGTGIASAAVAIAGAFGVTKASMLVTIRGRLHQWSGLLWERAVTQKVSDETLLLDRVLPPSPVASERRSLAEAAGSAYRRVTERLNPDRSARPRAPAATSPGWSVSPRG
jgi:hypothetical protein